MPCFLAARMANGSCFLASSCLTPQPKLLYLIKGIRSIMIEQIQATVFINQIVRDKSCYGQSSGKVVSAKKNSKKKIPKKKA